MAELPTAPIPLERIERRILLIRGQKVLLDSDLAALYAVETAHLNRAVTRNISRFPSDFMLRLTTREVSFLRCQFGISNNPGRGGRRYLPLAFTEQGVAMLSGVLHSPRAVQVNIAIMRAFVALRRMLYGHNRLARKLACLERVSRSQRTDIRTIFKILRELTSSPEPAKPKIGFQP
jgi:hypothetical protein